MHKKIVLKIFFLFLFTGYFCSTNFFSHKHYINGQAVTHSHPFNKGHTHENGEYEIIHSLIHYSFVFQSPDLSFLPTETFWIELKTFYAINYEHLKFNAYSNKGPPFSI